MFEKAEGMLKKHGHFYMDRPGECQETYMESILYQDSIQDPTAILESPNLIAKSE